jgi:23S rRNA (guanosine2251-2'-O)-methyltransferase
MGKDEQVYLYGINTVTNLLTHSPERVLVVYLEHKRTDKRIQDLEQLVRRHGISIQLADQALFTKRLGEVNHQGVMVQVKPLAARGEAELYTYIDSIERVPFLLCLDGVQDPHNLGACLRSADAAGADAVIVPRDNAATITPTVSKVASGAAEMVPFFQVTNLARCLRELKGKGVWCIGLGGEASQSLFETDLTGPLCLVMGAEGKGLRRLTAETCDSLAALPMLGTVSSLNVSVATGIALYEALRQRCRSSGQDTR